MGSTTDPARSKGRSSHLVEWTTGLLCSLLVAGLFVMLVIDIVRHRQEPARFEVSATAIEPAGGRYRVTVAVHNPSLATGAQVHVRGDLMRGDEVAESADVTFDYVASESAEKGALFFAAQPSPGTLRLTVVGYTDP
ncbi:TIGR02588 family protein [Rhizobium sp. RU20A]|uniref:TIGR02588 family protein n=1 Tax=Rhizobium sp. RU20A TaxID=1907412 RepID=UPI0009568564|nr:TIGR02588 family protein [Rhizobium sp. RU20A]SIQ89809.1 TIGR02588 family protein [Rhizobium sp. RU20A]